MASEQRLDLIDALAESFAVFSFRALHHFPHLTDHVLLSVVVAVTAAGRAYVAEIDIPKREYIEKEAEESVATDEGGMNGGPTMEAVPFDIDRVTLTLWAVE